MRRHWATRHSSPSAVLSICPSVFFVSMKHTKDDHPIRSTGPSAHPSVSETVASRKETISMLEVFAEHPRGV